MVESGKDADFMVISTVSIQQMVIYTPDVSFGFLRITMVISWEIHDDINGE